VSDTLMTRQWIKDWQRFFCENSLVCFGLVPHISCSHSVSTSNLLVTNNSI